MKILHGNNLDLLKDYPDNHFDAIVTDPPYGLGKEPNAAEMLKAWVENGYMEIKGSGFMGKEWDAFVPQPIFWKEVFRVLKPGGHCLAFYGTRTYDWGVMAMRLAGFECREQIFWCYGSGFPKSHNISKAIDKMYGAEREVIGSKVTGTMNNKGGASVNKEGWDSGQKNVDITAPTTEDAKKWEGWGSSLKPAVEPIVLARKPLEKGLSIAENVLKWGTGAINIDGCRIGTNELIQNHSRSADSAISKGKYGDSKEQDTHQTSGQALGRFPANLLLSHHPECEMKGMKKVKPGNGSGKASEKGGGFSKGMFGDGNSDNIGGGYADENGEETVEDWCCHENCSVRILDEQSGVLNKQGISKTDNKSGWQNKYVGGNDVKAVERKLYLDTGSASRFFYIAKASKSERNKGLEKENWFYDLELIFKSFSFTEQNLFIWESEELNQSMDLIGEAQQKKDTLGGIVALVEGSECYTTSFGKKNEVLFPKAIKFTTSTGIKQTIELKTLKFYQPLNTNDCIADVIETNKENGLNLAENAGMKNLLKLLFTKEKMAFPLGVKIAAKKTPQLISVKDAWKKTNIHSTVKPVKLMQYLVRLVTPPNGKVLDPFCGSGTTGIACKLEGFDFVGMEQDAEYCKIAEARIENFVEKKELSNIEENKGITQLGLF